jgi:hypothetical protein
VSVCLSVTKISVTVFSATSYSSQMLEILTHTLYRHAI